MKANKRAAAPAGGAPSFRTGAFRWAFLGLVALAVLPLWVGRYLPMLDLPQHLGLITALHRLEDPTARFGEYFLVRPGFTPYLGYYWLVHLLSFFMPVEVAGRLFLSAYVVGLGVGVVGLARALGRSEWLGLFAFAFAYSFEFYMGFVNYLAAVALLFCGLAVYADRLQGRRLGIGWSAALVVLPVAIVVTHAQPYLFFLCGLAALAAFFPGRRLATALHAAPSLATFLGWSFGGPPGGANAMARAIFHPFARRVREFPRFTLDHPDFKDQLDLALFWAVALVGALGLYFALRAPHRGAPSRRQTWAALILACGALAAYLFAPTELPPTIFTISPRFATMSALFLAVAIPLAPGATARAFKGALVAVCAAQLVYVAIQFRLFDRTAGDFRTLAEKVEAGSCVAMVGVRGHVFPGWFDHFAGYLATWRGAIPSYTFAAVPHSPLAYRRAGGGMATDVREALFPVIPEGTERWHIRNGTLYATYGGFYRYFLLPRDRAPAQLLGAGALGLRPLGESGPLALWENPAGRCGR